MQTLHGIRFLPIGRIDGMLLGLDSRFLGTRGLSLMALLTLATLVGQLGENSPAPVWLRLCIGFSMVPAVLLTSLAHELGHVVASRLAGLSVRAVVLAPQGGFTIRGTSDEPAINFLTALAGPLANAVLGIVCLTLAVGMSAGPLSTFVLELTALHFITAAANLLPFGPMDGRRMLAAWGLV
jgi:Zn-dependent protease